jgi:hypothetical protein
MVGSRRRLLVVALAAAVVVGAFLPSAAGTAGTASAGGPGELAGAEQGAAAITEWSPSGAATALVRARSWADTGLVSFAELLKTRAVGLVPATFVAGWAVLALAWSVLRGLGAGSGTRLRRSPLPILRAPPALV